VEFRGDLRTRFENLYDEENRQKRGKRFEMLVCELFRQSGYEVFLNPKTASPRQTDMLARRDGQDMLVEVKWLTQSINSPDMDSLRSRLRRSPPDIVGCIFSMSDYSQPALSEALRERDREVLLFSALEIHTIFGGKQRIEELIRRKRDSLRIGGRNWFLQRRSASTESRLI
jgi:hypothetical protein